MSLINTKFRIQAAYSKLAQPKEVLGISAGELSYKPELFPHGEFIVMDVTVDGDLSTAADVGYDGANSNANSDPTKKPTFAEKLMGVKNTQCDMFLSRVQAVINTEENREMIRLREDTNKVRYDYKEIDLDKKKRDLEKKKKKNPLFDTEEDEFELARMERYLFYNPNHCFYMEKKNSIPLRGTAKSDPYQVTPTVARARKIMQDMVNERKVEAMQEKRNTMLSRKSTRSVRFQEKDDEDGESKSHYQMAASPTKSMASLKSRPKSTRFYTPSATPMRDDETDGVEGVTREEHLLAYLRRAKAEKERFHALVMGSPENDEIPDDFSKCAPTPSTLKPSQSRRSRRTPSVADSVFEAPSAKPMSATIIERNETNTQQNGFHLPSISGDNRHVPEETPEAVQFGALDEHLPAHEVALLKQADRPLHVQNQHNWRPTKSAVIRRSTAQTSHSNRRYTSTSAHPMKRRHMTHAMLRQEKHEVENKVSSFLNQFDQNKRKYRLTREPSQPSFKFKNMNNNDLGDNQASESRAESPSKLKVQWQKDQPADANKPSVNGAALQKVVPDNKQNPSASPERAPRPRNPRGVPSHTADRSKRHTATYKLRKMVEELMKNRTTAQQMDYDKMMEARLQGRKTPDLLRGRMSAGSQASRGGHTPEESSSPSNFSDVSDDDE